MLHFNSEMIINEANTYGKKNLILTEKKTRKYEIIYY